MYTYNTEKCVNTCDDKANDRCSKVLNVNSRRSTSTEDTSFRNLWFLGYVVNFTSNTSTDIYGTRVKYYYKSYLLVEVENFLVNFGEFL